MATYTLSVVGDNPIIAGGKTLLRLDIYSASGETLPSYGDTTIVVVGGTLDKFYMEGSGTDDAATMSSATTDSEGIKYITSISSYVMPAGSTRTFYVYVVPYSTTNTASSQPYTLKVRDGNGTVKFTGTNMLTVTANPSPPSVVFDNTAVTVGEGSWVIIPFTYSNLIPSNPNLYVSSDLADVDVYSSYINYQAVLISSTRGVVLARIKANSVTDGVRTAHIGVFRDALASTGYSTQAASVTLTINDDYTAINYKIRAKTTNLVEGSPSPFEVTASTSAQLYWTINGTTADFATISGTLPTSIATSYGYYQTYFALSPLVVAGTPGVRNFTVSLRTGSTSGPVVATLGVAVTDLPSNSNQGVEIYDNSGGLILDATGNTFQILGTLTFQANMTTYVLSDSRFTPDNFFHFITGTGGFPYFAYYPGEGFVIIKAAGLEVNKLYYGIY